MNEQEKKSYLERYKEAKKNGELFFPDALVKDALVSLLVLAVLIGLIVAFGVPLEARANPADTSYTPRPEWYFLFLFQLLKYFPGQLEVIGVFVLPTIAILLLVGLPFLDRSAKRHPLNRPIVTGVTTLVVVGIGFLTIQSLREAPPPVEAQQGDPVAQLYTENCAGCHGPRISVPTGTNLHEIIAQGSHNAGMPAWNADLSTDEIDALAGFISSPSGSRLFSQQCSACHQAPELVASDPIQLRQAIQDGPAFPPHQDVDVPVWTEVMTQEERTDLLNFLVAPDGQRLFVTDCSSCHGQSVAFNGSEAELRSIIEQGGLHLEMPAWRGQLAEDEVQALAAYVVDPQTNPQAESLFQQNCSSCHGDVVPRADSVDSAREIILQGGPHQTMPVWGDVLTASQLDALVSYTMEASKGTPVEVGRELFGQYCTACHGDFGEGGPNPSRAGDVIAPISSAEYLHTRDDVTLKSIISQGQPNFGMSPFGTANGGPLDDEQIAAIVNYIRTWEDNPPVELPPEVQVQAFSLTGGEIFSDLCAQCHGEDGRGLIGPSLANAGFQGSNTDQQIFDTINEGHPATAMIGWGEVLSSEQIAQLVDFIRSLPDKGSETQGEVSFQADILPVLDQECSICHGSLGGWDASSYESVMTTGDNAPVVVPGEPANSLLTTKLEGTQDIGGEMPPSGPLAPQIVDLFTQWVQAGAPDN
ncbi:MAG: c-type cytochrome [Anaerolineales bacterium]